MHELSQRRWPARCAICCFGWDEASIQATKHEAARPNFYHSCCIIVNILQMPMQLPRIIALEMQCASMPHNLLVIQAMHVGRVPLNTCRVSAWV